MPQVRQADQRAEVFEAPETVRRKSQEAEPRPRPSGELLHEDLTTQACKGQSPPIPWPSATGRRINSDDKSQVKKTQELQRGAL